MAKILIADKTSSACADILREGGLDVDVRTGRSEDELAEIAGGYEGIVVRSATKVTRRVIEAASKLQVIGRAGVGVDNIDLDAATECGVVVMNTPLGNIVSAAEQAVALMVSLARNTPAADASMKEGRWDKKAFTGVELAGKTLGVIGLGKIGTIVARVGRALSMRVTVFDPYLNPDRAAQLDVEQVEFDTLLAEADFVTLHVPLNDSTRGLVGAGELGKVKKTARLVNCARGGGVDEAALSQALMGGEIAGAALDVYAEEPLPEDSPLRKAPNIVLTPHLGASTAEAQEKVASDLAKQFVDYFVRGEITNPVNLSVTLKPHLVPFGRLAGTLGKFASQIAQGGLSRVEVGVYGELGRSADDTQALAVCALQGVLGTRSDEHVNMVNVGHIALSRGIELNVRRADTARTYRNLIVVKLAAEGKERSVAGTLYEGSDARIVAIDEFAVDVRPAPWMLAMSYPDMPGMIGKIGTVLGEANINIADMSVGRREKRGQAVVVLTVDEPVPDEVAEHIRSSVGAEVSRIQI